MGISEANHKRELMAEIIAKRAAFEQLAEAGFAEQININLVHGLDIEFFLQHKNHTLKPISEYGYFFGDCYQNVDCDKCGTRLHCILPEDHDGPCKSKEHDK